MANPAEVFDSLLTLALAQQPARTFLDPEGSSEEESGGNELDGKRYYPLLMTRGHGFVQSEVDLKYVSDEKRRLISVIVLTQKPTRPPICQPSSYIPTRAPRTAGGAISEM